jgi:hypothetical protein
MSRCAGFYGRQFIGNNQRRRKLTLNQNIGRPEMARHMIACVEICAGKQWDNESPGVAEARARYEAGTHEMCFAKDGEWAILYSIPRKVKAPKPEFFKMQKS